MGEEGARKKRRPRRPFPHDTLEEALVVPRTIKDENAGNPMRRLLLADAMGRKPGSSAYKYLLSSSRSYGLTEGTEKAEYIELASLGKSIVEAEERGKEVELLQQASLTPSLFREIYSYYKEAKLPSEEILKRTIVDQFKVDPEWADECIKILVTNGRFTQIIRDISGSPYVMFGVPETVERGEEEKEGEEEVPPAPPTPPPPSPRKTEIFIAHGKNKVPLEQLKGILDQFKIPYKVAVDEPHIGRPISGKVAEIMRECSSAIFIFTADEEYVDAQGDKTISRATM